MHPYREAPARVERPAKPPAEELVLYALFILIGAIPVAIAVADDMRFGVEATIGLLLAGAGTIGTIAHGLRRRRSW